MPYLSECEPYLAFIQLLKIIGHFSLIVQKRIGVFYLIHHRGISQFISPYRKGKRAVYVGINHKMVEWGYLKKDIISNRMEIQGSISVDFAYIRRR